MDYWQYAFIFVLVAGGLAILGRFIVHSTKPALKAGGLPPQRDPAIEAAQERFRDGGTMRFGRGDVGFHPSVRQAAVSQVHLTPRNLSLINSRRRTRGLPTMNRRGFQAAIAAQRQNYSVNHDDWLTYLILYECLFADHQGRTPDTSITVTPDAPFNGQGGTFAGAGASGDWTAGGDPAPATIEPGSYARVDLGLAAGAALLDPNGYKDAGLNDPTGYKDAGPNPSDGNPEAYNPPQPSAPDPTPSSSDSGGGGSSSSSSYDSGSSSSSSYDSGSSSSSSDSGGGGGGGSD